MSDLPHLWHGLPPNARFHLLSPRHGYIDYLSGQCAAASVSARPIRNVPNSSSAAIATEARQKQLSTNPDLIMCEYTGYSTVVPSDGSVPEQRYSIDAVYQSHPQFNSVEFDLNQPIEWYLHGPTGANDVVTLPVLNQAKLRWTPSILNDFLGLVYIDSLLKSLGPGPDATRRSSASDQILKRVSKTYQTIHEEPCYWNERTGISLCHWFTIIAAEMKTQELLGIKWWSTLPSLPFLTNVAPSTRPELDKFLARVMGKDLARAHEIEHRLQPSDETSNKRRRQSVETKPLFETIVELSQAWKRINGLEEEVEVDENDVLSSVRPGLAFDRVLSERVVDEAAEACEIAVVELAKINVFYTNTATDGKRTLVRLSRFGTESVQQTVAELVRIRGSIAGRRHLALGEVYVGFLYDHALRVRSESPGEEAIYTTLSDARFPSIGFTTGIISGSKHPFMISLGRKDHEKGYVSGFADKTKIGLKEFDPDLLNFSAVTLMTNHAEGGGTQEVTTATRAHLVDVARHHFERVPESERWAGLGGFSVEQQGAFENLCEEVGEVFDDFGKLAGFLAPLFDL